MERDSPSGRNPVDDADWFAVDEDDALVALPDLGKIGLGHHRFAVHASKHLQERCEILVTGRDVKDTLAAVAVERLDDDVAVFVAEGPDGLRGMRDERGRHHPFKIRHEELLGRVPDTGGVVDDQSRGLQLLENVGGGDVGHVERGILSHQDDIQFRKVQPAGLAEACVVSFPALQPHGPAPGHHPAVEIRETPGLVDPGFVAALLRFEGKHEGGVGIDVDGFDGIHLEGNAEHHGMIPVQLSLTRT